MASQEASGARRFARALGTLRVCVIVLALSAVSPPAVAVDNAEVDIAKSAPKTTAGISEDFTYFLSYSCVSLTTPCDGATVTDVLPPQVSRATADVEFGGNFADVNYTAATGSAVFTLFSPLPAGATAQISITVHFPPGTANGTSATNVATIDATNAAPSQSNAVVVTAAVPATWTSRTPPSPSQPRQRWRLPDRSGRAGGVLLLDEVNGSGIASCVGSVAEGAPIDTTNAGQHEFTVVATDVAGNKHNVTHTYSVETSRPDGRIKRGAKGAYAGDGIYNTTASGQTRSGSASSGKSVKYFVLVQNDAAFPDRLRLTGQGSTRLFKVRYTVGGINVTPRVVGGTYRPRR